MAEPAHDALQRGPRSSTYLPVARGVPVTAVLPTGGEFQPYLTVGYDDGGHQLILQVVDRHAAARLVRAASALVEHHDLVAAGQRKPTPLDVAPPAPLRSVPAGGDPR